MAPGSAADSPLMHFNPYQIVKRAVDIGAFQKLVAWVNLTEHHDDHDGPCQACEVAAAKAQATHDFTFIKDMCFPIDCPNQVMVPREYIFWNSAKKEEQKEEHGAAPADDDKPLWLWFPCAKNGICSDCDMYHYAHQDAQFVEVDGVCRGTGAEARASVGIYWGENNPHNFKGMVGVESDATKHKAELSAVIMALDTVKKGFPLADSLDGREEDLKVVIVKTVSTYVFDIVTKHLKDWKSKGFKTGQNEMVKNKEQWEQVDTLITILKDERDIDIYFWHVNHHHNLFADEMANTALDKVEAGKKEGGEHA